MPKRKTDAKKQGKHKELKNGVALAGRTDKQGRVHWQEVSMEWRQVRPPIRKAKRKTG
jgi:hypothetical protein